MLFSLPTTHGWSVVVVTDKVSKSGRPITKTILCITDKAKAEAKAKELRAEGQEVKIYESFF